MKTNKRGFTLVELLVVIAIVGVLFMLILPAVASTRERAHTMSCLNNMKQLAMAALMYADDNDEAIPDASETELGNYIDNPDVYLCPRDNATPSYRYWSGTPESLLPAHVSGSFSEQILYIETDSTEDKEFITLDDGEGNIENGDLALDRHDGRLVVVFLDGHVVSYTDDQFVSLLAQFLLDEIPAE